MSENTKLWIGFIFTFVAVLALQSGGCFTNHWVRTDCCGDIGLFSDSCLLHCNSSDTSYEGSNYLSIPSSSLQVFSFAVHLIVCVIIFCALVRDDDDDDDDSASFCCCCSSCFYLLYPIAGIASVVGCSMVKQADLPENSSLRYSFYLCLFSGIYVIFQVSLLCCSGFYLGCCREKETSTPTPPSSSVATTTSSGQMTHVQSNLSYEVAEHNEIYESGGMVFMRKLRITRVRGYFQ